MDELHTADDRPPWDGLEGTERHAVCVAAAREGNRDAINVLVDDLTPLLWHVARGQGLDRAAVEDVVQTVWLAFLKNIKNINEPKALVGYLVVTTRREARRTWTPNKRETHLSDEFAEQLESDTGLPEDVTLMDDRDRRLWLAFGRLTTRCQELLRLTVLAGRAEYRAVAEALAMPHGSIGPTRGRCLTLLRNYLETEGGSR
jgi:RNA polymerase sigma factor (sigma-70 family)